ncbi:MAG TPA: PepSY domain-containing protein [Beijerinckiaceae bacterium]|nr:PepSY domain-containing protein [Beijerinckiaceae bacterium]
MTRTLLAALAIALVGGSAHAQSIELGPGGVRIDPRPPEYREERRGPPIRGERRFDEVTRGEAVRIARRNGMVEVDEVVQAGPRWRLEGTDRRGRDMRVVIDRRTGEVLEAVTFR